MGERTGRTPDMNAVAALTAGRESAQLPVRRVGFVQLGQTGEGATQGFSTLSTGGTAVPRPDFSAQDALMKEVLSGVPIAPIDKRRNARVERSKKAGEVPPKDYEASLLANARGSMGPSERQGAPYVRYLQRMEAEKAEKAE